MLLPQIKKLAETGAGKKEDETDGSTEVWNNFVFTKTVYTNIITNKVNLHSKVDIIHKKS